jgi:hypothetical protein
MTEFTVIWERIRRNEGEGFRTKSGHAFTYKVPADYVRITRDGHEIDPTLTRTSFEKAAASMPVDGPTKIKNRRGASYTWAILMDVRIRGTAW